MKKTLTLKDPSERPETPALQRKGRGWAIAESRLDTIHDMAREMRRRPTEAQALLEDGLVRANLGKFRFRRQVVIGSAIVDFACQPLKVVVEIDEPDANPELDRRRDRSLAEVGITVLRFSAADVLGDVDGVVAQIVAAMKARWEQQRARPGSGPARPRPAGGGYRK